MLISYRVHRGIGWCLVALVVALSLIPTPTVAPVTASYDDKIAHCLAYAMVMGWFAVIAPRASWWRLAGAVTGLGIALEACQAMLPYRTASWGDVLANTLGVAIGAAIVAFLIACIGRTRAAERSQ